METANLYCPREMVFTEGQLSFMPVVPNAYTELSGSMLEIEVDILEVHGERAIVLLPELLRKGGQHTATVGIHHLN